MTPLTATLYEYASLHCLPDYRSDPEYIESARRFEAQEATLCALLDEHGKRLLNDLLNEYATQFSIETNAFFEAAFQVCGELNRILGN